jgi:hypothetical protein
MLKSAALVMPALLLACAAPSTNALVRGDAASMPSLSALRVEPPASPDPATGVLPDFALDPQQAPPMRPPGPRPRFTLKGGYYDSSEDGFDDGTLYIAAWLMPRSPTFSTEFEIGYLDADGSEGLVDREVWAIPLMANARFTVPVGERFELYAGLGFGSFYYDAEADAPGISVSGDGFLFGGDGFFGGAVQLGDNFYVGLEGKYYLTGEASELGGGLDAFVGLLTLGFAK